MSNIVMGSPCIHCVDTCCQRQWLRLIEIRGHFVTGALGPLEMVAINVVGQFRQCWMLGLHAARILGSCSVVWKSSSSTSLLYIRTVLLLYLGMVTSTYRLFQLRLHLTAVLSLIVSCTLLYSNHFVPPSTLPQATRFKFMGAFHLMCL